ncbi:MAG: glycosyltransferase [Verrucomicrobiota bacterium]
MKVLIDCDSPFALAHGGMQVQIEQTLRALPGLGVEAEALRWWDERQRGDVLHQFGVLSEGTINLAHRQGMKVVMTLLLSQTCNRTPFQLATRRWMIQALRRMPKLLTAGQTSVWDSCRVADHIVVGLEAERQVVIRNYGIAPEKVSAVPLGLPEAFLKSPPARRDGDYLISVGTIAPVKRALELARLARETQVPVLFVGKPFEPGNAYWKEFSSLVDGKCVRHQPHVSSETDLLKLYQSARGHVLMSHYENWSFVAHEAAACGLPLLVMDLPWSRERFGDQAKYFPRKWNDEANAVALKSFYEQSATAPAPKVTLHDWTDVARKLKDLYEGLTRAR